MYLSNNKMSFQAVYRLPYSEKNLQEYNQYVEPPYSYMRGRPTRVVLDTYKKNIDTFFEVAGNNQGYSADWARQNAKYNGIKVDDAKNSIFVITGENDIEKFDKVYKQMAKSVSKKTGFWGKITSFFSGSGSDKVEYNPDKSVYLNAVAHVLRNMRDEHEKFDNYLNGVDVVDVDTTQQLFRRMLQEK